MASEGEAGKDTIPPPPLPSQMESLTLKNCQEEFINSITNHWRFSQAVVTSNQSHFPTPPSFQFPTPTLSPLPIEPFSLQSFTIDPLYPNEPNPSISQLRSQFTPPFLPFPRNHLSNTSPPSNPLPLPTLISPTSFALPTPLSSQPISSHPPLSSNQFCFFKNSFQAPRFGE